MYKGVGGWAAVVEWMGKLKVGCPCHYGTDGGVCTQ